MCRPICGDRPNVFFLDYEKHLLNNSFCNLLTLGNLLTLLAVWLSGNVLASINVVALRQTRLVPGWVTVCGRVNHLSMQLAS